MQPVWRYLFHSLHLASLGSGYANSFNDIEMPCMTTNYATCVLSPDPAAEYNLSGTIYFSQDDDCGTSRPLRIRLSISGFPSTASTTKHGFHVHTYGDLSNGCSSAGGHYNPFNRDHGDRCDDLRKRHVGDFGNLAIRNGEVVTSFTDRLATLTGENTIVGRAIVVHAGEDDLGRGGNAGSIANGNAGPRLACCVIGRSPAPN